MKPMIFSDDTAYNQLKERGKVTSARGKPREEGEEVWIRKTRTGPKQFEAEVEHVTEVNWVNEKNLIGHLHDHDLTCGFDSAYDWYKVLDEMHDEIPNPLYIHYVERKDDEVLE